MSHLKSKDVHFIMGSHFHGIDVRKSNNFDSIFERCQLFDWVQNELKKCDIQSIYMTYYEWAQHYVLKFGLKF